MDDDQQDLLAEDAAELFDDLKPYVVGQPRELLMLTFTGIIASSIRSNEDFYVVVREVVDMLRAGYEATTAGYGLPVANGPHNIQ